MFLKFKSGFDIFVIHTATQRATTALTSVAPTDSDDVHGDIDVPPQLAATQILPKN